MAILDKELKYLIIGSKGQLGKEFVRSVESRGSFFLGVDIDEMDIEKRTAVTQLFNSYQPDVVINCAAYNFVDLAEDEEEKANAINYLAVKHIVNECKRMNAFLMHFSSDYIFDGEKATPYTEEDEANPINKYG